MNMESGNDCYLDSANRLVLGQYRATSQGKDAELVAKDRYEVAVALIEIVDELKRRCDIAAAASIRGVFGLATSSRADGKNSSIGRSKQHGN